MFTLRKFTARFSSLIVIFSLTFSVFQPVSVSAQGGDGVERLVNTESGRVSFIGPESGRVLSAARALETSARPQDPAMALAKRFGPEFGLKNPAAELSEIKTSRPEDGRVTVHYQQKYQGIPVMGAELIVNTNQNGDLYSMNGEVSPDLALQTQPNVDPAQARDSALQAVAKGYQKTPADFIVSEPELWIFDESLLQPSARPVELVWRMEATATDASIPVRELVLVNAQKGGVSLHFNQIDTAYHTVGEVNGEQHTTPTEIANNGVLSSDVSALVTVTLYVATTGNDSNSCTATGSPCLTINGAIGKATSGDTIRVTVGTFTGTGTEVVLINKSVTLSGGWNASFTTQSSISTIDGQASRRGVVVPSGVVAVVEHFKIQNGYATSDIGFGAGIANAGTLTLSNSIVSDNVSAWMGGGVVNYGTLTINNTTIKDNIACAVGSGGGGGGGIENYDGTLTLNNSTVSGNAIPGCSSGSGIDNSDILILNNSTVSGNIFDEAIYGNPYTTTTLNNSTVSGNTGGGIRGDGSITVNNSTITGNQYGIEADPAATLSIQNSIVAGNSAFDCFGTIVSSGYNLIGNNSNCAFNATIGDFVGTSTNPINPRLTPLQDNGGPTLTHAVMVGSTAINTGNPVTPGSDNNACLATDQRGTTRPVDSRCDIGAYEGSVPYVPSPYVNTYTANGSSSLPGALVCNQFQTNCTNGSNPDADAAHKYAIGTYNLYLTQFNRDSIDNNGMTITSTVHYCDPNECPYDNAFWDGAQMVYGEGYSLADDVAAHELTHGITQYESNLFYYYQSGAINESLSDVFGEYYDQTNGLGNDTAGVKWLHGEDLPGGAYRNMSNPPAYGDPDKMTSANYYLTTGDSGGVHTNSGINNKAAFIMVDGGTFNGKTVTALGWVKTAAIYYEAQSNLLASGADYSDLYYALQQACANLIGQKGITSGDCLEVKDAVDAVEMNLQPVPDFNTNIPACDADGEYATNSFYDDLEAGAANWVHGAAIGTDHWTFDSIYDSYAHSGQHYMYADDWPTEPTDTYLRMTTGITVPPNGKMLFHHAYSLETDYDGGVLEYSTNAGSSWTDAGSLMDGNGYDATLSTISGNPLGGHLAFNGISHGYISTRLNLSSLAGQNVMFRFRMGLDEAAYYGGWWLDDVQVYTCAKVKPSVVSSMPANANPTNATNVNFTVTFSDPVTGVNTSAPFSDFMLTTTGITGASITSVSGTGATRTVTVNTGTGNGTIRLDIVDDDTILDALSKPLGGTGLGNGNFNSGGTYAIDKTVPTVSSITRVGSNPNAAPSVSFSATFSEPVSGVDVGDFTLNSTEVVGATISSVSGSGATRVVKVKTGTGDGTIRLNLVDNNTIIDSAANPLGGAGAGNGNFTTGEIYAIDKPDLRAPILRSPQSKVVMKNKQPTFWWTNVTGSQTYEIVFATDSAFANVVGSEMVSGSLYAVLLPFNDGRYYWHVRAYNTSGQPGTWSTSRMITIDTTAPSIPVLSSPADHESNGRTPTFKWQSDTGATYQFQYDNNSNFSSPVYTATTRGNFRRPPAMKVGTYYWRVRAKDAAGNWSTWSTPFTINITGP